MQKILLLFIAVLLSSCATKYSIKYDTENITAPNRAPIPINVRIMDFEDLRAENPENATLFENNRKINLSGKNYCINAEKHYKSENVATEVSKLIAEHFKKSNLFKEVYYGDNNSADYYLTGKIMQIYGVQERADTNLIFYTQVSGGKRTVYITLPKKPVSCYFDFTDIKLYDKRDNLVLDFGGFEAKYDDKMLADIECKFVFQNVNNMLKKFISEIAELIYSELLAGNFWNKYGNNIE
jgi:hypothetical protein